MMGGNMTKTMNMMRQMSQMMEPVQPHDAEHGRSSGPEESQSAMK